MNWFFAKAIGISTCILLTMLPLFGQQVDPNALGYYNDAYLFTRHYFGGTARIQGIGGAGTALGGDLTSIWMNPAGLGFFNKSEWSVSPSLNFNNSYSTYSMDELNTGPTPDSRTNFNIAQMGVVFNNTKDDLVPGSWRGVNWGIGITRQNSYHHNISYSGTNNRNSLIDYYLESAQKYHPDDLFEQANRGYVNSADALGFAAYLVDYGNFSGDSLGPNSYGSWVPVTPMQQKERISRYGAQNTLDISLGSNYDDKLYLGAGVGIQFSSFRERRRYEETTLAPSVVSNFVVNDELDYSGIGINLNLGIIYRPDDWVRFGLSYRSPTAHRFNSTYYSNIAVNYNNWNYPFFSATDPPLNQIFFETVRGSYNFRLNTPHRLNMGMALFAGKNGFVSADVEYVRYNKANLRAIDGISSFEGDNRTIISIFEPTINFRIGGEYRYQMFRFRGGYAFYPSGMVENTLANTDTRFITVGAGIRLDEYYIDLAVVNRAFRSGYLPYTLSYEDTPKVSARHNDTNVMVTFGTFF